MVLISPKRLSFSQFQLKLMHNLLKKNTRGPEISKNRVLDQFSVYLQLFELIRKVRGQKPREIRTDCPSYTIALLAMY